jgi:NADH dehydrogenase/NADH:ubiquinone oxidoreductase subunit G
MVKLTVDDREIDAAEGTTLLQACLNNGIYIPNLCHIEGTKYPSSLCRLCFVEIEGQGKPAASCTVTVRANMAVKTDTPAVRQLQRSALRLLLSVHRIECKSCPANKKCELQRLAKFLKVALKSKHLEQYLQEQDIVQEHPYLDYYPNRCVLCGKCYYACRKENDQPILTFAKRGFDTVISFYGDDGSTLECEECHVCVEICPVGALIARNE